MQVFNELVKSTRLCNNRTIVSVNMEGGCRFKDI